MKPLIENSFQTLLEQIGSVEAVPGGGSTAALVAALGSALGQMAIRITTRPDDYPVHHPDEAAALQDDLDRLLLLQAELVRLADDDCLAFQRFLKLAAKPATEAQPFPLANASQEILEVPFQTAQTCVEVLWHLQQIMAHGNRAVIPDACVGAYLAMAALQGSLLNFRVNLIGSPESDFVCQMILRIEQIKAEGAALIEQLEATMQSRLGLAKTDTVSEP